MNVIIDYGVGNIGSIANMLRKINAESVITSNPVEIAKASRLILCGIGAFDDGMAKLETLGILDVLKKKVLEDKTPIMGVCLGMQLFTRGSEEGKKEGLSFVDAYTKKFDFGSNGQQQLRVPHMGWNEVELSKPSRLFENMYEEPRFYFVHSFHAVMDRPGDELLKANYGYPFTAAFEKENIIGVQFHPEKSHKYGMRLYEKFIQNY